MEYTTSNCDFLGPLKHNLPTIKIKSRYYDDKIEESPGPADYYVREVDKKLAQTIGVRYQDEKLDLSPGPADYNIRLPKSCRPASFSKYKYEKKIE